MAVNNLDHFSPTAQQIFVSAEAFARPHQHRTIGPQHVFLGFFTQSSLAFEFIVSLGFDLHGTSYQLMSAYPDRAVGVVQPKLSHAVEATISLAIAEARRLNHTQITTAHLLIAMLIRYETWLRGVLKPVAVSNRVLIAILHQTLLTSRGAFDQPMPTRGESERLQRLKRVDTSSVVPSAPERLIRQIRGAIGLPPLKPCIAFDMIDYLAATIDILPNCAELYTYRANQLIKHKKYLEATLDCSQALRLKPDFSAGYLHRAVAYQEAGDLDRSLKDYDQALHYRSNDWMASFQRGNLWLQRNEPDKAFADFHQVLAVLPAFPPALSGRAEVCLSKRDFHWAIVDYEQVLRQLPDHAHALHGRGTAKVYQGDFDGAQVDFDHLLRIRPQSSYSHSNLGWLALNRGEYDKAIQRCKRAIEIDPKNGAAHYSRGAANAALRDIPGAVADFKRSLELWKTVGDPLTAHIEQEMRDFLSQHVDSAPFRLNLVESPNDGG